MDTQLLPYRLKSARRKRRLLIKDRDKQLLALDREQKKIKNDPDYKTTVPLDEPYQKGWKRLFVLKPEVKRSDEAAFYQGILDAINEIQYHYDASFKNSKRIRRWHRYYNDGPPKLKRLNQRYWQSGKHKLSEAQCACFTKVDYWSQYYYRWNHYYEFIEPNLFEIVVLPHIITTIKVGDVLLAQEESFLKDYLYNWKPPGCRLAKIREAGITDGAAIMTGNLNLRIHLRTGRF